MICKTIKICSIVAVLFAGIIISFQSYAEDVCKEAKEINKQRLQLDAELRIKRSDLSDKMLNLKKELNKMDREMAAIEKEIINSKGEVRKGLWEKYDSISEGRDRVAKGLSPIQKEYSETNAKRTEGKINLKKQEIKKRYACIINEELDEKVQSILTSLKDVKKFDETKKAELKGLAIDRASIIEALKKEYGEQLKVLEGAWLAYQKTNENFKIVLQREDEYDRLVDKQMDDVYNQIDKLSESLDKYSDDILGISEKMLMGL